MASCVPTSDPVSAASLRIVSPCIDPQFAGVATVEPAGRGFMPVIEWHRRSAAPASYQAHKFRRKVKLTATEALAYAHHAMHWLQIAAAERYRRHQRQASYSFLIAAE